MYISLDDITCHYTFSSTEHISWVLYSSRSHALNEELVHLHLCLLFLLQNFSLCQDLFVNQRYLSTLNPSHIASWSNRAESSTKCLSHRQRVIYIFGCMSRYPGVYISRFPGIYIFGWLSRYLPGQIFPTSDDLKAVEGSADFRLNPSEPIS